MAFPSADVANRRVRELTGQTRPRRPQRPPTTNENLGPLPHVQHFSNTLGVLNPNDGPIGVDIFGYPVPPIATQADLDFYLLNPHQARPSVATSSSCLQVQDYEREGGWMVDAFGRQYYQARGKLEEISSEQDDNDDNKSATTNAFHDKHHEHRRPLTALSPMNTGTGSGGFNLREFASRSASPLPPSTTPPPAPRFTDREQLLPLFSPPFISEYYQPFAIIPPSRTPPPSLPPNTTPPPRPLGRQMSELSPTSSVYPRHAVNGYAPTPLRTMTPAPPKNHAIAGPLDAETEIALVQECLRLVTTTVQDIQFMYTVFLAIDSGGDLAEHSEICLRLEESVSSVRSTLTRRNQIGEEEWRVRSAAWHLKYGDRLRSLRRTLKRLMGIKKAVEARSQSLRPKQRMVVLFKLQEHERKMADLASKFIASFDRLRLRHLHYLLTEAHKQSYALQKQKQDQARLSLSNKRSFERRWKEGKAMRADLRREFYSFRPTRPPQSETSMSTAS